MDGVGLSVDAEALVALLEDSPVSPYPMLNLWSLGAMNPFWEQPVRSSPAKTPDAKLPAILDSMEPGQPAPVWSPSVREGWPSGRQGHRATRGLVR